jgi:hypothetical protein
MSLGRLRGTNIAGFRGGLAIAILSIASCDSSPTGTEGPTPPPPLEAVDYGLLGSGKVLFHRTGHDGQGYNGYYLIDAEALRTSLVLEDKYVWSPHISPDGTAVAYLQLTDLQSVWDVYVADLTGGGARQLSSFAGNEGGPAWTPDASGVVYLHHPMDGSSYARILRNGRTGGTNQVLRTFQVQGGQAITCPIPGLSSEVLALSTRGGMAFTCFGGFAAAELEGNPFTAYSIGAVEGLAWSPDGQEIAVTVVQRTVANEISGTAVQVLNVGTGALRTVAVIPRRPDSGGTVGQTNSSVCWLPGNGKLVFTAPGEVRLRASVYVIGADGNGLAQLTTATTAFDSNISCTH